MCTDDNGTQTTPAALRVSSTRLRMAQTVTDALFCLLAEALSNIPPVRHASISRRATRKLSTPAASDQTSSLCDDLQYRLQQGPCIDAISRVELTYAPRLATDPRWPKFGPAAAREHAIGSVLSLPLLCDPDNAFGLNLYAEEKNSFTETDVNAALMLAAEGELAIANARNTETSAHLATALQSNRDIGIAIGILMNQHKVSAESAFGLLKRASQNTHRKLARVALDVTYTGMLDTVRTWEGGRDPSRPAGRT